jgi:hypothetical protein
MSRSAVLAHVDRVTGLQVSRERADEGEASFGLVGDPASTLKRLAMPAPPEVPGFGMSR